MKPPLIHRTLEQLLVAVTYSFEDLEITLTFQFV
jgi:hypothetical protein